MSYLCSKHLPTKLSGTHFQSIEYGKNDELSIPESYCIQFYFYMIYFLLVCLPSHACTFSLLVHMNKTSSSHCMWQETKHGWYSLVSKKPRFSVHQSITKRLMPKAAWVSLEEVQPAGLKDDSCSPEWQPDYSCWGSEQKSQPSCIWFLTHTHCKILFSKST